MMVGGENSSIASFSAAYEIHRRWDDEKVRYVCYPVLREFSIDVDPRWANKKIIFIAEWEGSDDSGTWGHREESTTEARLEDGRWVVIRQSSGWVTWSNAASVGGRLVPACETGEGWYIIEIDEIDDEDSVQYLNELYGDEENTDVTITEWLEGEVEDIIEEDEALKRLVCLRGEPFGD